MQKIFGVIRSFGFLPFVFYGCLLAVGGFHEFVCCLLAVVLAAGLIFWLVRKKQWTIALSLPALAVALITLFYGLSLFWAVDAGMAWVGFLKYLPLPLFMLCAWQEPGAKETILRSLPYVAAATAVISGILMQIPALHGYFAVDGRLSGFFQYPNTFAMFLLVAQLLLIGKKDFRRYDLLVLILLLGGILYSGSRTVFVLVLLANLLAAFFLPNRKLRIGIFALLGGAALLVGIAALCGAPILARLSTISLESSTFLGRILYMQDALPLILKHPFGMGYRAFYYLQQEVQTGVYSVAFIHNDFMHLMLEIGWLPALSLMAAGLCPLFSKKFDAKTKIILGALFLHFCFDFDLQFIAIFWLYLLLAEPKDCPLHTIHGGKISLISVLAVLGCAALYMALPLGLNLAGQLKAASDLYPYYTPNETALLTQAKEISTAAIRAEKIHKQNPYVSLVYSVRARNYYEQGDFGGLIATKQEIFEKFPFLYEEYEEYGYMLANGILLYEEMGDLESANYCKQQLQALPQKLLEQTNRLSPLGKKILDQPQTELPQDLMEYIAETEAPNE